MGELTRDTPKPLLEVAGRPVLDYLVDQLAALPELSALHVVSNARYAGAFEGWAGRHRAVWKETGRSLEVHDDGSTSADDRLGAIGDLRFVLGRTGRPPGALVAAGDNIFRFRIDGLWRRFLAGLEPHRDAPSVVLALEERDPARLRRTGVLELDGDRVVALHEKPEEPPSRWACPSCYALSASALGAVAPYLDAGRPHDEIGRFVGHVVDRGEVLAQRVSSGLAEDRLHVGNPRELAHADRVLRNDGVFGRNADRIHTSQ